MLGFIKRFFWKQCGGSNGRLPWEVIMEYSDAVAKYGPKSVEVQKLREKFAGIDGFRKFAEVRDQFPSTFVS